MFPFSWDSATYLEICGTVQYRVGYQISANIRECFLIYVEMSEGISWKIYIIMIHNYKELTVDDDLSVQLQHIDF